MQLTSPAFAPGTDIPAVHTCKGNGTAPLLSFAGVPAGARSLVLIVHDPDAPGGDFVHWVLWNIPPSLATIGDGPLPAGALEGRNDFGAVGYGPPCPPSGIHRYLFDLYALDCVITELNAGTNRAAVMQAIQGHILEQTQLVGRASA